MTEANISLQCFFLPGDLIHLYQVKQDFSSFNFKDKTSITGSKCLHSDFNKINSSLETSSHILSQGIEAIWDSKEYTYKLQEPSL